MGRTVTNSIAIIGEGETEWFYFDSLRVACRYPFKVAPDFPQHSDIKHILKLVESYLSKQYDYIVCLFDMDRLFLFPSEMQLYQQAKKEYGKKKYAGRVIFVETNPCTEFWFLLHFLPNVVCRRYESYEQLLPDLQKARKMWFSMTLPEMICRLPSQMLIVMTDWWSLLLPTTAASSLAWRHSCVNSR